MDKSTDINDLPFKKQNNGSPPGQVPLNNQGGPMRSQGQGPPNPLNTSQDGLRPAANFAQMPGQDPRQHNMPSGMRQADDSKGYDKPPFVGGAGQGFSEPVKPTLGKKEFFGLKETDYKSTVVVFALILIFSSNFFFEMLRNYLPAVMQDGKTTLIGSLIGALLGSVIYIVMKCVANLG